MLGLVDYSDSDNEEQQAAPDRQQLAQPPAPTPAQSNGAAAPAAGTSARPSGLPSAAQLLEDRGTVHMSRLPAPDFGTQPPTAGQAWGLHGAGGQQAGTKRGHPDTRGPLPNPMSLDNKLPRSGGALNTGGAKPTSPPGVLLPPQLRGRANVATEDLSVFTKQSQRAAQQRSGGSGASGRGAGPP